MLRFSKRKESVTSQEAAQLLCALCTALLQVIIANELLCGSRRSFKRASDDMTGDLDAFSGADNENQVVTCSALWTTDAVAMVQTSLTK